jgi:hypothetical protein
MLSRVASPVWGTVMARRKAYQAMGLFRPEFSFFSDVEMWMRLNLEYAVAYVPEPLIRIIPHEPDRPYAYLNWRLELIHIQLREHIARRLYATDAWALTRALSMIHAMRDRRWLFLLGCAARRRRWDLVREGLRVFEQQDSAVLRTCSLLGRPLNALSNFSE